MLVSYETLSRNERRAANKLAKKLLRCVTPNTSIRRVTGTIRGALLTCFMKPQNVEAVLIYDDGQGNWWGDLVLRHGSDFTQYGIHEDSPVNSYDEALRFIKCEIAQIKSNVEKDLIVQRIRRAGIDPRRGAASLR